MSLVADVVNRQDDGHGGIQGRRIGGGMNQIDGRAASRAWKANSAQPRFVGGCHGSDDVRHPRRQ